MKPVLVRLHFAVFLWGFTGVLGRMITLNEGLLVWWRLLITVLSLWLLFWWQGKINRVSWRDFLKIGGIGTLLALHWLCFYGSIKYANVSIALTCMATSGLLSAVLEPLFFRRRINPVELLLGLFALVGIGIIYFSNLHFSAGIYIGLLATVLTVTVSLLNKKMVTGYEPRTMVLYQLTGGFAGLTLLMPLYNHLFPTPHLIPVGWDWLWLVVLSWVCTIFTFFLYLAALKRLSAFSVNLTVTLEPVYGILLAFMVYHENKMLSAHFYIGFALILLAVGLQMWRIMRQVKANCS
jgi:drug/metabolite transporter (DMT)-like permease